MNLPQIIETLKAFGPRKLAAAAAAFLLTAALVSSVAYFTTRPDMTVLYAGLDPADAGQVLSAVEAMGVQAVPSNGGTAVSVPRPDVDRVRMALAEKGLPNTPGVGYELFDKADGFGLTTFMQRVNRLRAMEGELARTVSTLKGVDGARVHLVLPDRESFSRTAPDPSASVVVRMKGGRALEISQARAIRHLVASAVPALKPSAVTITDAAGQTILSDGEGAANGTDSRTALEGKLQRSIEEILAARLGADNVRVGVTVEIETAREVTRKETFDPNGRVIRSTQTVEDKQRSSEGSSSKPSTVQQNLPSAELLYGAEDAPASTTSDKVEETVNYEISSEVKERVLEPGDVRKVSVAVLVNGSYETDASGEAVYVERTREELDSLEQIVKTAAGFDGERGDVVSIENLQFAATAPLGEDGELGALEILAGSAGQIVMWLILALATILLTLFVLRPLVKFVTERPEPSAALPQAEQHHAEAEKPEAAEPEAPQASREALVTGLHEKVDENPDEAVAVLRAWIQEGEL